ncbi:sugar kinase [Subtercola endophyticus]|uniref:sugar kinase n=1 Tax=Subtercola endophyticus TaxID=2895559 RepID=UPI001E4C3AA3|nr:sugar kinase [Subtercola endophyticus]UFS60835.1 sugar kinase [Subtercola endophyticus]
MNPSFALQRGGVITVGETMGLVTSDAASGTALAHDPLARIGFGGAESNVAIGLSRLGVPTTWVSRLGDDLFGELIRRELRAEGVTVLAKTDADRPTGMMVKQRRRADDVRVTYYRSASAASRLAAADLPLEHVGSYGALHVTGITLALGESPRDAIESGMLAARAAGTPVSFDLNFRSRLWTAEDAGKVFARLVPLADILFAGVDEARLLFPDLHDSVALARALQALGPATVLVKLGEKGAVAAIGKQIVAIDAVTVKVVDTVGAGDSFAAGFLAATLRGEAPVEALTVAARVAAMTCASPGDWEGAPTAEDLRVRPSEPVDR